MFSLELWTPVKYLDGTCEGANVWLHWCDGLDFIFSHVCCTPKMAPLWSWGANIQEWLYLLECWHFLLNSDSFCSGCHKQQCWQLPSPVLLLEGIQSNCSFYDHRCCDFKTKNELKVEALWQHLCFSCSRLRWLTLGQILQGHNFGGNLWLFPCSSTRCLNVSVAQESVDLMGCCPLKSWQWRCKAFQWQVSLHCPFGAIGLCHYCHIYFWYIDVGGLSTGMFQGTYLDLYTEKVQRWGM